MVITQQVRSAWLYKEDFSQEDWARLLDKFDVDDWKEKIDSKKESVENDEATLKFCQSMTRVLEKKKQAELKRAQNAAQDSINVINNLVKEEHPLPPMTDSILGS